MKNKKNIERTINKAIFWIIILIIIVVFLILLAEVNKNQNYYIYNNTQNLSSNNLNLNNQDNTNNEVTKKFIFIYNDSNIVIDGEVIINNISYGFTKNGSIDIPYIDNLENITFKGIFNDSPFELLYYRPETYTENNIYNEFEFLITSKDLDLYINYTKLKNNDIFSQSNDVHWNHMPITYKIYNYSFDRKGNIYNCEFSKSQILNIHYAIERFHNIIHSVSFKEVNDNEDISILGCEDKYYLDYYDYLNIFYSNDSDNNIPEGYREIQLGLTIPYGYKNIFSNVKIYIFNYEDMTCGSDVILHELFHAFGIGHTNVLGDIMYPMDNSCSVIRSSVSNETINKLNSIYS